MRSVGYRPAWQHLRSETTFAQFRAAGIAATRQLAKWQITWPRSMKDAEVIAPFDTHVASEIEKIVCRLVSMVASSR